MIEELDSDKFKNIVKLFIDFVWLINNLQTDFIKYRIKKDESYNILQKVNSLDKTIQLIIMILIKYEQVFKVKESRVDKFIDIDFWECISHCFYLFSKVLIPSL